MRYVLDSSVAFKWVVPEVDTTKALALRSDLVNGIHEFIAPEIYVQEVAHALTRGERQKRIAIGDARRFWTDTLLTPPDFFPSHPLTGRAIEIASAARIGVYDCIYVALAEREGCEFITADARLIANLQAQFPFIIALSSLP